MLGCDVNLIWRLSQNMLHRVGALRSSFFSCLTKACSYQLKPYGLLPDRRARKMSASYSVRCLGSVWLIHVLFHAHQFGVFSKDLYQIPCVINRAVMVPQPLTVANLHCFFKPYSLSDSSQFRKFFFCVYVRNC